MRLKIRRFSIPLQLQNPIKSRRHFFGYSAVGAAAVGFSYECLRLFNGHEIVPTVASTSQQLKIEQYTNEATTLCQHALDGNWADHVGDRFKPKIILKGAINEQDLARFELEAAKWKQFLMGLFTFKSAKEKEELFLAKPELKEEEDVYEEEEGEELMSPASVKAQEAVEGTKKTIIYDYWREYSMQRRMTKLVKQLQIHSEFDTEGMHPLAKELPRFLFNVLDRVRGRDEGLTVSTLKILANTVHSSLECAELVAKSDWLPLLASMITNPVYDKERILAHKILVNVRHALGADPDVLPPHLYELHRPSGSQAPDVDIVFVHGLRGSAFHSWRQRDAATLFWPRDWLAQDIDEPIRLIALDYSSQLQRPLLKSMENLEARSRRFQGEFAKAGIGKRPIMFICHSMGGLLVKQMLINNPELLDKTVGILFVSTPHHGTPVASKYGQKILMPTEDVLLLKTDSQLNQELNERFNSQSGKVPLIWTVLECKETPILRKKMSVMLVPHESGAFGRGTVYHLNEHHHHLCKPIDRNSPIYGIVFNFVRDSIRHLKRQQK